MQQHPQLFRQHYNNQQADDEQEMQTLAKQILDKQIDRRNFRKKFISMDLIEDTGEFNIGCNGRPAKLYRFKENIKQVDLF